MSREKTQGAQAVTHVKSNVIKLMENRNRLLAPFPYVPSEVHGQLFNTAEWEAISLLEDRAGLIEKGNYFYIDGVKVLLATGEPAIRKVTIKCGDYPMPNDRTLKLNELPDEMRASIAGWGFEWYKLKRETAAVVVKLEQLARYCNTIGQVVRIWPELQGFMTGTARYMADNARVKSRYPGGMMEWSHEDQRYVLEDRFKPPAFEVLNVLIAEALMLPFTEGDHVATVAD